MLQRVTRRSVITALLGICLVTLLTPVMRAQAPAYFQTMSIPPGSVGTCIPPVSRTNRAARLQPTPRLVMTSRTPSARREMTLMRDTTGAIVGFNEMVHVSTGRLASVGETVVATLRPDGRTNGYLLRTQVTMSEPATPAFDSASLRRMRETAKRTSSQMRLDTQSENNVRALATWLSKRCPG
jgi:hypothetical protein